MAAHDHVRPGEEGQHDAALQDGELTDVGEGRLLGPEGAPLGNEIT